MLRSLSGRLTLAYLAISLVVILVAGLGIAFSEILTFGNEASAVTQQVRDFAVNTMTKRIREGHSLSEAAAYTAAHMDRADFYLYVYDDKSRVAFNGVAYLTRPEFAAGSFLVSISSAMGVVPAIELREGKVPGGFFQVLPDYVYLSKSIATRFRHVLPFTVIALAIGFFLIRRIVRALTQPLRDLPAQFRLLAEGDFTPQPSAETVPVELCLLNAAYNEAAENIERAVSDRERLAETIRTFISDAGHELKTPLTIIMGYLDAVENDLVGDPQDVQRILQRTYAESRRMRNTIANLSALARLDQEPQEVGTFDVAAIAREVVDSTSALTPNLHLDAPSEEELLAFGNADEVREAIVTVIENAVKYAPGSPIDVRLANVAEGVKIEISDAGPGMSAYDRDHAFDRFYRGSAHSGVEGSGLGLAIAKRAIERADGRIALSSEPGSGTAVTMYLKSVSGNGTVSFEEQETTNV